MSLDTVVEDIREEARARAEEIKDDGEQQAEAILAEARADADALIEDREAEVEREIEQEREQALSSANLEAKQQRLSARRDVLQDVREEVEADLAALKGNMREELTRELLVAAAEEFDADDEVEVFGRADDEALLKEIISDFDNFTYGGEYDCLGGVVVEGTASRVRVNNTFDSILDAVWDEHLREISSRLFDDQ